MTDDTTELTVRLDIDIDPLVESLRDLAAALHAAADRLEQDDEDEKNNDLQDGPLVADLKWQTDFNDETAFERLADRQVRVTATSDGADHFAISERRTVDQSPFEVVHGSMSTDTSVVLAPTEEDDDE